MGGEETGCDRFDQEYFTRGSLFSCRRVFVGPHDELNLPSDASYRFERGVDPEMVLRASQRATELIREIAGGTPAKEINVDGKLPANPADVSLRYEKCERVVGIAIKPKTVDEILTRFGLKKISAAEDNEMEDSELSPRFAARCRSYRRSRASLRCRENSGNGSQPVHAFDRG